MDQLGQSDFLRLLDCVRSCYAIRDAETYEGYLRRLVSSLCLLIPSTHVTYDEMDLAGKRSYDVASTAELNSPTATGQWKQHMMEQPVLAHFARTGDGRATSISSFWTQRKLHDSGLYAGCYRNYDMEDSLCIAIPGQSFRIIGVGWHRDRKFTDREISIVNLIRPHIVQALESARIVGGIRDQLQKLESGLDCAGLAVVRCDGEGRVQYMTALARKYLLYYFKSADGPDGRVPLELLHWIQSQESKLNRNDPPPVRFPFAKHEGGMQLTVRLLAGASGNFLLLNETGSTWPVTRIQELQLSPRESEVLGWVAQGKTNSELADILGISGPTAKKHVEHILQKLGVETRTAAAAVALSSISRIDRTAPVVLDRTLKLPNLDNAVRPRAY